MHGIDGGYAGYAFGRRAQITLHGEGARRVLAKHDMMDLAQAIATRGDGERRGEVVAVLVGRSLLLCVQSLYSAAHLIKQSVIGMRRIVQSLWSGSSNGLFIGPCS